MADLQETLSRRERRSRVVAVLVGVAILVVVIVSLIIGFSGNDDDTAAITDGDTVEVVDGVEDTENVFDPFAADETNDDSTVVDADAVANGDQDQSTDDAVVDDTEPTANEADDQVVTTTTPASDDLPNTGPAENAAVAAVVMTLAYAYFKRSKLSVRTAQLKG